MQAPTMVRVSLGSGRALASVQWPAWASRTGKRSFSFILPIKKFRLDLWASVLQGTEGKSSGLSYHWATFVIIGRHWGGIFAGWEGQWGGCDGDL